MYHMFWGAEITIHNSDISNFEQKKPQLQTTALKRRDTQQQQPHGRKASFKVKTTSTSLLRCAKLK